MRAARIATTVIFLLTGATMAAWSTRIPAIQDRLDLSPGSLAVAILGLEAGAVIGLPAGGALVTRLGSRTGIALGFAVFPTALLAVGLAPGLAALAVALGVMAAANSVVDVAMNAQGVELERRYRRPVLSGLHAGHSFGMVGGGLAAIAAAGAGVSPAAHLGAMAVVGVAAGISATRWLVREDADRDGPAFVLPSGPLALLGAIAFCAFLIDGAAYNWSAVHLRTERDAAPAVAAAAFTVFALALALGRLPGDRLVERFGRTRVVQGSALVSATGLALAITVGSPGGSLVGWAVFGLGTAAIAPTVLGAAAGVRGVPAPVAIAAVTTVGYLGSFTGPSLIGALAEASDLSTALGVLLLAAAAAALLARPALSGR
jgi:MFS family permease